jgi:hypothetical protein
MRPSTMALAALAPPLRMTFVPGLGDEKIPARSSRAERAQEGERSRRTRSGEKISGCEGVYASFDYGSRCARASAQDDICFWAGRIGN